MFEHHRAGRFCSKTKGAGEKVLKTRNLSTRQGHSYNLTTLSEKYHSPVAPKDHKISLIFMVFIQSRDANRVVPLCEGDYEGNTAAALFVCSQPIAKRYETTKVHLQSPKGAQVCAIQKSGSVKQDQNALSAGGRQRRPSSKTTLQIFRSVVSLLATLVPVTLGFVLFFYSYLCF